MKLLIVALCLWGYKDYFSNAQAMEHDKPLEIRENENWKPTSPRSKVIVLGNKDTAEVDSIKAPSNPDASMKKMQPYAETLIRHQGTIKIEKIYEKFDLSSTDTSTELKAGNIPPSIKSPSIKSRLGRLGRDGARLKEYTDPAIGYHTLKKKVPAPLKHEVSSTIQNPLYKVMKEEHPDELEEWEKSTRD